MKCYFIILSDRRGHFIICTVYIHNVIRNINFRLRFLLHNGIFPHGHLLFSFSFQYINVVKLAHCQLQ